MQRTDLYQQHLSAGARLVDFAGWEMPLHYGSQIEEHHAVRRDAGVFDVSHMLAIDMSGADACALLRRVLANDVAKLSDIGDALYSCMLNAAGGVIDDLIAYRSGAQDYRLVVNAGRAEVDLAWLQQQAQGTSTTIAARRDLAILAVQGPQARARVWQALPHTQSASATLRPFQAARVDQLMLARTGYTGEDGFELLLPAPQAEATWQALLQAGVKPCGLGARDTLRLEAGMSLYGQEMDASVTPMQCGLAWTVDLSDARAFNGRAALETQRVDTHSVGLLLLDKGVLRAHQVVHTVQGEGVITSGGFAPTMNRSIALARVPLGVHVGARVQVTVRDKQLSARVVKPPFVRHGKILIKDLT